MIVSSASTRPFDEVDRVGVAIMGSVVQRHTGFLYRIDDGPPTLVHLGWHYFLARGTINEHLGPDGRYLWADVAELEDEDRRYMASYLSVIDGQDPQIPYGLSDEGISFDRVTGRLLPPPDGRGLTCATFLLAVYAALGHQVLDMAGWPAGRPGDLEWQQRIVAQLRETDSPHADLVEADLGCARVRPEEIVGASATPGWPHTFPAAEAAGMEVLHDMDAAGLLAVS